MNFDAATITPDVQERFWSKVDKRGENECWKWGGKRVGGNMTVGENRVSAARLSYFFKTGKWPNRRILKSCLNESCVNPNHVYEANNIDDPHFREKFWSGVQPAGDDQCWPWMRAYQTKGYGQIYIGDTAYCAHRIAFYLANGFWPEVVCHSCDNPPCCNPKHLINGTYKKNMEDRSERGRCNIPRGEKNPQAKLTDLQIRQMCAEFDSGIKQRDLADKFGCSRPLVSVIVRRKHRAQP